MLRFGLFDGGATARVVADNVFMDQSTLRGYAVQTNAQTASATGSAFYAEDNDGNLSNMFTSSGGGTYTKVGTDFPSFDAAMWILIFQPRETPKSALFLDRPRVTASTQGRGGCHQRPRSSNPTHPFCSAIRSFYGTSAIPSLS